MHSLHPVSRTTVTQINQKLILPLYLHIARPAQRDSDSDLRDNSVLNVPLSGDKGDSY